MSDVPDAQELKWQGLMRASILSATTNKLYRYIMLADQKAMGLVVMNSIIVPLAMNGIKYPEFQLAASIALVTGVFSIFEAIVCIFPKRGVTPPGSGKMRFLHFSDIGSMTEDEYLSAVWPIYNDKDAFAREVLRDIHDISRRVLIPKFRHLVKAYSVFFAGNLIAVLAFLYQGWFHGAWM